MISTVLCLLHWLFGNYTGLGGYLSYWNVYIGCFLPVILLFWCASCGSLWVPPQNPMFLSTQQGSFNKQKGGACTRVFPCWVSSSLQLGIALSSPQSLPADLCRVCLLWLSLLHGTILFRKLLLRQAICMCATPHHSISFSPPLHPLHRILTWCCLL